MSPNHKYSLLLALLLALLLGIHLLLGTSVFSPMSWANTQPQLQTQTQPQASTAPISTQAAQANTDNPTKVNFSPIFIELSDAMGAVKNNDPAAAQSHLQQIHSQLNELTTSDSGLATQAHHALEQAIANPNADTLSAFSAALYAFEQQQNPVDYSEKRQQFAKKVMPAYDQLHQAIMATQADDPASVEQARQAYNRFNATWTAHERVVRNTSKGHYGKIETAMALIRVSIESHPANTQQMQAQSLVLKQALDGFNQGNTEAVTASKYDLHGGIALLQAGLDAFTAGDTATGQAKLGEFINIWVSIEGEVSTRNPSLYSRVESQIPIIMANGADSEQQHRLQALIDDLSHINPAARYTAIDAMLILLREGLEALLIIMALLSALTAAKQHHGKKWVYAGTVAGLLASVAGALALQRLFPSMTSGANREMLEGYIGIVAVVMMIGIGAWLHSKSSVNTWNAFIKRHMGNVLTTGSFVSLFGLAFLSVLREGAETILFYVGILPNISMGSFLLGVGMAVVILAGVAVMMLKTSVNLPIPTLFKVLTWVIYGLGFKILGVSVSALQLTNILDRTVIPSLPAVELIGFYPTVQGVSAQVMYIVAIVALQGWIRGRERVVE